MRRPKRSPYSRRPTQAGGDGARGTEKRVEDQKVAYTNYQPQEMTKLSDPVIETRGDTVILCVSDDNSAALSVIDEAAAG